ncbi:PREDICTED: translation initiation factor IF-2-like isoform X2 [Chinchilla lanigera]|uniref:translation initiation factor IF-2-like isoform X2 n=1 Tax=Chinchilla lanigera TaxID=34839 RepID=UPI0006982323|nr:PREDICTED: translation initiation factor IF-2-like isoform X2 [Chinchilla lanigera]
MSSKGRRQSLTLDLSHRPAATGGSWSRLLGPFAFPAAVAALRRAPRAGVGGEGPSGSDCPPRVLGSPRPPPLQGGRGSRRWKRDSTVSEWGARSGAGLAGWEPGAARDVPIPGTPTSADPAPGISAGGLCIWTEGWKERESGYGHEVQIGALRGPLPSPRAPRTVSANGSSMEVRTHSGEAGVQRVGWPWCTLDSGHLHRPRESGQPARRVQMKGSSAWPIDGRAAGVSFQ